MHDLSLNPRRNLLQCIISFTDLQKLHLRYKKINNKKHLFLLCLQLQLFRVLALANNYIVFNATHASTVYCLHASNTLVSLTLHFTIIQLTMHFTLHFGVGVSDY